MPAFPDFSVLPAATGQPLGASATPAAAVIAESAARICGLKVAAAIAGWQGNALLALDEVRFGTGRSQVPLLTSFREGNIVVWWKLTKSIDRRNLGAGELARLDRGEDNFRSKAISQVRACVFATPLPTSCRMLAIDKTGNFVT